MANDGQKYSKLAIILTIIDTVLSYPGDLY